MNAKPGLRVLLMAVQFSVFCMIASDLPSPKISDSAESDSYFQIRIRPNLNLNFEIWIRPDPSPNPINLIIEVVNI